MLCVVTRQSWVYRTAPAQQQAHGLPRAGMISASGNRGMKLSEPEVQFKLLSA